MVPLDDIPHDRPPPPKSNIDTKHDGFFNMYLLSNMASFWVSMLVKPGGKFFIANACAEFPQETAIPPGGWYGGRDATLASGGAWLPRLRSARRRFSKGFFPFQGNIPSIYN